MPFKLVYFHPPDTFKVKVKVTETSIFFVIWFVYIILIFTTTTMPFKLVYFHPPDTFKVEVKVTETSIFWSKIGNFENVC